MSVLAGTKLARGHWDMAVPVTKITSLYESAVRFAVCRGLEDVRRKDRSIDLPHFDQGPDRVQSSVLVCLSSLLPGILAR
jgi:hypothetical protein